MSKGIYTGPSEDNFKSETDILYEGIDKQEPIVLSGKNESDMTFNDWMGELAHRRDVRMDVEGIPSEGEIEIKSNTPIVVALMGDQHISGFYGDYELLRDHANFIRSCPKAYVVVGGDVIDGAAFNPAQDDKIASFNEETAVARKMLDWLSESMLCACAGDHDMWAGRGGITMYHDFKDRYKRPLFRGSSTLKLKVGETDYKIVMAHRLPGHSMYNKVHGQNRESKFGQQGADVYVGWHNHQKGIAQQVAKQAGDEDLMQTFVSPGAYKYSDGYAQKLGFAQQSRKELGAVWLVLHPDRKEVEAYWNMESAKERIEPYLKGSRNNPVKVTADEIIKEITK